MQPSRRTSHQVVDRHEPGGERQLGVLEHRPRGEPDLPLAAVALEQPAGPELAEAPAAAGGAGEALAPAHPERRLAAGLLGTEPLPELGLAQALDRAPRPVRRCHPPPPPALKAAETLASHRMRVRRNQEHVWAVEFAIRRETTRTEEMACPNYGEAVTVNRTGYRWRSRPAERKPGGSRPLASCSKAWDAGLQRRPADFANGIRTVTETVKT